MSGGHWNYSAEQYDDAAYKAAGALHLMAAIEHELDWGHSCDTCLECARRRVCAALDEYFDNHGDATEAIRVVQDRNDATTHCDKCLIALPSWGRRADARPTIHERDEEMRRRGLSLEETCAARRTREGERDNG